MHFFLRAMDTKRRGEGLEYYSYGQKGFEKITAMPKRFRFRRHGSLGPLEVRIQIKYE